MKLPQVIFRHSPLNKAIFYPISMKQSRESNFPICHRRKKNIQCFHWHRHRHQPMSQYWLRKFLPSSSPSSFSKLGSMTPNWVASARRKKFKWEFFVNILHSNKDPIGGKSCSNLFTLNNVVLYSLWWWWRMKIMRCNNCESISDSDFFINFCNKN